MLTLRLFASLLMLALIVPTMLAQPKPPQEFQPDSQLGEFYRIGATRSTADKKIVLTEDHLMISLDSASLAVRFPNNSANTVAAENEQLLVLSGTFRNPQKEVAQYPGGSPLLMRIFGAKPGQIYHMESILEQQSLRGIDVTLKPNESVRFTMAVRIPAQDPATNIDLRRRDGPNRKYALQPVLTKPETIFRSGELNLSPSAKASIGQVFDLDTFDMKVVAVRETSKAGSYTASAGKRLYTVEMQVTNRMLRPEPWGWQFCTPDIKDGTGASIPWSRDMLDAQTGQTFSRDLAPAETATVLYVFSSDTKLAPQALSLKMVRSKRQVDLPLTAF